MPLIYVNVGCLTLCQIEYHTMVGRHHYTQWDLQLYSSHQTSQLCEPNQKCALKPPKANNVVKCFWDALLCWLAQSLNQHHILKQNPSELTTVGKHSACNISNIFSSPGCQIHDHPFVTQEKLHWLQPSGYLTQPLATQWLTQRLIGVLKASYLTHHNNKYRYQAGPSHDSFPRCPRMSLISSLLLVGLSQTAYACIPHLMHRCAFGATLTDIQVAIRIWWEI